MVVFGFNSRTLGRVRPTAIANLFNSDGFQFTHPGKGATRLVKFLSDDGYKFQFTHPGKGATAYSRMISGAYDVSIHAPWEGCDFHCLGQLAIGEDVSIHAPWEGCDEVALDLSRITLVVSIHAPWEGCDVLAAVIIDTISGFNSRTLGRVRRVRALTPSALDVFQFTHPGKGATTFAYICVVDRKRVSIHAPWEGCDSTPTSSARRVSSFNSRTLGRVRLTLDVLSLNYLQFQFTHPGKGATHEWIADNLHR